MTTICIDCRYINPLPSGIGSLVRALVERVPDFAPEWDFLLLRHPDTAPLRPHASNVRETIVEAAPNSPASMWFLAQHVDFGEIDLFHSPSNILPAGIATRTVTTVHDLMWLTRSELCSDQLWSKIGRHFFAHGIRRALEHSDAILTVSDATREDILKAAPQCAVRTWTIAPGAGEQFKPGTPDPDVLQRLGIEDAPYILTVGQHAPYKNHQGAIRAFAKAFADDPGFKLVMVQRRGPSADRLRNEARALGVEARVLFTPVLAEDDLVALYQGATALLHPSLCEGFGMPILEAMASGCPVITSNHSAMPEVAGGAGLLVDPLDMDQMAKSLAQVANEPKVARELREKGLIRARQFSWDECARKHVEIYRKVLSA